MTHVEDNAPFAAREETGIGRPVPEQFPAVARETVRVDVSRAELLAQQRLERPFRVIGTEIHHHRDSGGVAGADGLLHRVPVRRRVVCGLDPDDDVGVLAGEGRGRVGLHVFEVLLDGAAPHPVADDVGERQDACPAAADDGFPEGLEVPPTGAPGVEDGRDPRAERVAVRVEAVVPGVRPALVRAREDVDVQIDQAGRHVEAPAFDHLEGPSGIDGLPDRRHPAVVHGDVPNRTQPVPRIDQVTALQQQVELGLAGRAGGTGQRERGGAGQELAARDAPRHWTTPARGRAAAAGASRSPAGTPSRSPALPGRPSASRRSGATAAIRPRRTRRGRRGRGGRPGSRCS